jgi:hypothetical protein
MQEVDVGVPDGPVQLDELGKPRGRKELQTLLLEGRRPGQCDSAVVWLDRHDVFDEQDHLLELDDDGIVQPKRP